MPTTTPNRGYTKPDVGGDANAWGGQLNTTIDQLDTDVQQAIDDSTTVETTIRQLLVDTLNAQDPVGTIKVHNSASAIPVGWAECDGLNGTPDLRGRVLVCEATGSRGRTRGTKFWGNNTAATTVNTGGVHNHTLANASVDDHVGRSQAHAITKDELPNVSIPLTNAGNYYRNAPGAGFGASGGVAQFVSTNLAQTEPLGLSHGHNHQMDHGHALSGATDQSQGHIHSATTPTGASYASRFIQKIRNLVVGDLP